MASISIIGSGSLARVLAVSLRKAGYRVDEIIARDQKASLRRAEKLARQCRAHATSISKAHCKADLVWFCISDDAITDVAGQLAARRDIAWKGKTVLHSSGALPASALTPLKKKGAAVASVHPMNSFVPASPLTLKGVPFTLEGDLSARKNAQRIIDRLEGVHSTISARSKLLYHAMGAFASPLYVSLIDAAMQVGKKAGLRDPMAVIATILRQTTENLIEHGAQASFSGPIKRSDLVTLRKHLEALKTIPAARNIYLALATNAADRLPVRDRAATKKLLRG